MADAEQVQAEAEAEINQLVQRYAQAVDIHGGDAVAACFTADGYFELSSGQRRDRAAMAAGGRDESVQRRHLFTPPVIAFASPDEATGEGFILLVEFDVATRQQKPPLMLDYHDEYRRTPDGWLLSRRSVSRSFA
ncbi:MAG: hypothetical protein JWQ97_2352 [Phenylobacterium sp.]|nr:hypothetical protein [Phenylobacterium sp.]